MDKVSVAKPARVNRTLIWSASIIVFILLICVLLPLFIKPNTLQRVISSQFRERTGFDIQLERPGISFLPLPTFRFYNIEIRDPGQPDTVPPVLTLEEFQCQLKILPLLIKQVDISNVFFKNANIAWPVSLDPNEAPRAMEFKHVTATVSDLKSNHWMKIKLTGGWLSDEPNLSVQGKVKIDFDHPDPADMSWDGLIKIKTTPLKTSLKEFKVPAAEFIDDGTFAWDGRVMKTSVSPEVSLQGVLTLDSLIYRINDHKTNASEKANYRLDLDALYDLNSQLLTFKPTTLSSSFLNLKINGGFNVKEGKAEELHLALEPIYWDRLPNYILPLASLLPVNLGFSGTSSLDVVVSGARNDLAIHASGDLTEAIFTYSRYFEKPKSVPFSFQSDHLSLKDNHILNGEVDITVNQAKLKGSFVKFDTLTGLGEITLMTNQFDLHNWETMVPTLSKYDLSGTLKLFVNVKNKPAANEQAETSEPRLMYHVAFDNVAVREKEGDASEALIENLNGSIDAGPMDLEAKKFSFQIAGSQFSGQAVMFFQEVPRVVANLESPALDLRSVVAKAGPISRIFGASLTADQLAPIQKSIESIIKPNVKIENLIAEIGYENNHIALKNLSLNLYEGSLRTSGWLELGSEKPAYALDVEIEKMSLARMSQNNLQSPIEGNLFLVAHADGKGFSEADIKTNLTGDGTVSITNGDLKTVDILGAMTVVAQLAGLNELASGHTRFQDINSKFRIGNGKITTDQLLLYSTDLSVDAAGDMDFQGNLNFRLQTSLSNPLSKKINPATGENEKIGPIPLILTGTLEKPSVKPDAALIQNFVINLAKQKFQKIFPAQAPAEKAGDTATAETAETKSENPLADLMSKDGANRSNTEKAVQTGMALLESLLKKPE